jgi:Tol biopolymer transport system component
VRFEPLGSFDDPYVLPDRRGRDTTDASGQAGTVLQAGYRAGTARLVVRVPALGYEDTATFTLLPGNPARLVALPADTAMYTTGTFAWRASVVDRNGNVRHDPVAVTAGAGPVAPAGGEVRATALGRGSWIARAGALADTGWVSVVPQGRVAGLWRHRITGDTARMMFVNLNGSSPTSFDVGYWWQPDQEWSPDGTHLLMNHGGQTFEDRVNHVALATPDGVLTRLLPDQPRIRQSANATYSRDGAWIYFSAVPESVGDYGKSEIWRVRPDGAGLARVGSPATYYEGDTDPSVSPDGRFVVFSTTRGPEGLRILDQSTGGQRTVAGGTKARWSPVDADLVAYGVPSSVGGTSGLELRLMRGDGTFIRRVSPPEHVYVTFSWSPDGKWLLADRSGSGITDLIEIATGQVLPVMSLHGRLWDPVWKP